ncbi:MAG TPA: AMP-binding protein [Acidimicrobiales bacterium]|jgi:acyl-CoA synthetase (AMP-forming)/AMP-acid ligase II|nr:AMP-binding protein [Acidimicrobiales bacterium]
MLTVTDLLERRSCSDRLAIVEGRSGEGVTWWEVSDQAARWRASGLEGPVGLALADPVAMATNFVAALQAGVIVAPLDPAAPPADAVARVAQLGLRSLVVGPGQPAPEGVETWRAGRRELRSLGGDRRPGSKLPEAPLAVAALMASSGTTGRPKVIPLTEPQLVATAAGVARELDLEPADRGYSPLPLFHINGLVVGVLSALVAGSTIVVDRHFSKRSFWSTVEAQRVTWLNLVPAILAIVGSTEPAADETARVRLARSASAPLPDAVRRRFEDGTGIPVVETYGMTEAASQICANPINDRRPGTVGRPVDVELRLVGDRVQIRGDRVTPAYWSADDGRWTSRPAHGPDGWLDTGDLGRMDDAGHLHLLGRDGDVINRGGEKIQPREVEEILLSDARVAAAVLVARPHDTVGEEPVAYVLPAPGRPIAHLACELSELCTRTLSRFKRPAEIVVAESLPVGPTGKVRRAQVRAMAAASSSPSNQGHSHGLTVS